MTSPVVAAKPLAMGDVAGVYKHSFANGLISGEKYRSENVLEIVEVTPRSAYFRTRLEFYNGHSCALWGIADLNGDELVYRQTRPPTTPGEQKCVLAIKHEGDQLAFHDGGSCESWCGARGSFEGTRFKMSSRQSIRYLPRLLKSREYNEALKERRGGR